MDNSLQADQNSNSLGIIDNNQNSKLFCKIFQNLKNRSTKLLNKEKESRSSTEIHESMSLSVEKNKACNFFL